MGRRTSGIIFTVVLSVSMIVFEHLSTPPDDKRRKVGSVVQLLNTLDPTAVKALEGYFLACGKKPLSEMTSPQEIAEVERIMLQDQNYSNLQMSINLGTYDETLEALKNSKCKP